MYIKQLHPVVVDRSWDASRCVAPTYRNTYWMDHVPFLLILNIFLTYNRNIHTWSFIHNSLNICIHTHCIPCPNPCAMVHTVSTRFSDPDPDPDPLYFEKLDLDLNLHYV